jgi:hypothetical protein
MRKCGGYTRTNGLTFNRGVGEEVCWMQTFAGKRPSDGIVFLVSVAESACPPVSAVPQRLVLR